MDERVLQAMEKWPNVPALFGWLRLDRRGYWYLKGRRIEREVTLDFIGRNYHCDEHGRWFFQNGPQRGFVDLDYTPWVYRSEPGGLLLTHTRHPVNDIRSAFVDEGGSVLLLSEHGIGLLDDHDLEWALNRLRTLDGGPVSEVRLADALHGSGETRLLLEYTNRSVPLGRIRSDDVARQFDFVARPAPLASERGERPTPSD